MSELKLALETRKATGKEIAKKLRREGKIPGIYYHHGEEPVPFSVDRKAVQTLLGHDTALINLTFDGKNPKKSVIREMQYDPITNQPIHIDLMGIKMSEKLTVMVPVHLVGTPVGVKTSGGVLQHLIREIEVECFPTDIPDSIEVDVTDLDIGDSVHVSKISIEKVDILADEDQVIANVVAPRIVETEIAEEGEEEMEPEVVGKEKAEEEGE